MSPRGIYLVRGALLVSSVVLGVAVAFVAFAPLEPSLPSVGLASEPVSEAEIEALMTGRGVGAKAVAPLPKRAKRVKKSRYFQVSPR